MFSVNFLCKYVKSYRSACRKTCMLFALRRKLVDVFIYLKHVLHIYGLYFIVQDIPETVEIVWKMKNFCWSRFTLKIMTKRRKRGGIR